MKIQSNKADSSTDRQREVSVNSVKAGSGFSSLQSAGGQSTNSKGYAFQNGAGEIMGGVYHPLCAAALREFQRMVLVTVDPISRCPICGGMIGNFPG